MTGLHLLAVTVLTVLALAAVAQNLDPAAMIGLVK
jgi:hypothetical protein